MPRACQKPTLHKYVIVPIYHLLAVRLPGNQGVIANCFGEPSNKQEAKLRLPCCHRPKHPEEIPFRRGKPNGPFCPALLQRGRHQISEPPAARKAPRQRLPPHFQPGSTTRAVSAAIASLVPLASSPGRHGRAGRRSSPAASPGRPGSRLCPPSPGQTRTKAQIPFRIPSFKKTTQLLLIKIVYVGMRLINSPSAQEPSHGLCLNEVLKRCLSPVPGLPPDSPWAVAPAGATPPPSPKEAEARGGPARALLWPMLGITLRAGGGISHLLEGIRSAGTHSPYSPGRRPPPRNAPVLTCPTRHRPNRGLRAGMRAAGTRVAWGELQEAPKSPAGGRAEATRQAGAHRAGRQRERCRA